MNKLFLSIVALGASLTLCASGFAQGPGGFGRGPGGPGGPGGGRGAGMRKAQEEEMAKLNLSPTQKKQVKALNDRLGDKMRALRGSMGGPGGRPDFAKMMPKLEAIRKERTEGMKAILNKKQFAKYQALEKERMDKMRAMMGARGGFMGGRPGPGGPPPRG